MIPGSGSLSMAKILIVDDSPTYRLQLSTLVERLGHLVVVASGGEEGLQKAREEIPDLVLMDVVMPGMNGFEAKRALARDEVTAHIPVVFVTTQNDDVDRDWGMRQGAVDYVTKPVDEASMQVAIDAAIEDQN